MPFGTKNRTTWLYRANFVDMFIRFDTIHECDGQTDRQMDTDTA